MGDQREPISTSTSDQAGEAPLDFSRWAVVAHKDDSGFGRQAADLKQVLGLGHHVVIPSERLWDKPLEGPHEVMLDRKAPTEAVRQALQGLAGIIFFERNNWHPELLPVARDLGVKTVCAPNWEWFKGRDHLWELCDLFVCTSQFALKIVQSYGWQNAVYVGPWPLNIHSFPPRTIHGPARLFIHNAGLVDPDDRKGTRDTIQAFKRVKRRDVRLLVRMQKQVPLPELDDRIEVFFGNLDKPADLYASGDVVIQPSKMEGNGFMVLEPLCSGMPVITTDYPPMSEYVQQPEMRVQKRWFKRKAFPSAWVKHAHLRLPRQGDLTRKIEWCAEQDMEPIATANRQWAEHHFDPVRARQIWSQVLIPLL